MQDFKMYFYHQKLLQLFAFQSVKGNTDKLKSNCYYCLPVNSWILNQITHFFFSVMNQCNLFHIDGKEGFEAVVLKLPNAETL